jgi:hypothetical protein
MNGRFEVMDTSAAIASALAAEYGIQREPAA